MLNELFQYIGKFIQVIHYKFVNERASIYTIIIYGIVFSLVYIATTVYYSQDEIKKNWSQYKCKPYIIPIAGLFKGDSFAEYTKLNFNECYWTITKDYFAILIKPVKYMYDSITKILGNAAHDLNQMRNYAKLIRELFQKMIAEVFEKIQTNTSAIQFYSEKFRNLMKKQHAIFQMIFYYLETIRLTFDGFINGPAPVMLVFLMIFGMLTIFIISMCLLCPIPFVGLFACPICALCFDPKQIVYVTTNSGIIPKAICNVEIGDILEGGSTVISTFHFNEIDSVPIYNYHGVRLSASHIIFENGKAVRAIDVAKEDGIINSLVCLGTTDNKIRIGSQTFSDYNEIDSPELAVQWNNKVLSDLNKTEYNLDSHTSYPAGFLEIDFSQNITGIIKHSVADNNIIMYDYNGIICSGNCIVYENNLWIRVYQSIHSKILPISQFPKIVYHANTNSGVYLHGGFTFRDFMETTNPAIYDWIHEIDLKLLNSQ